MPALHLGRDTVILRFRDAVLDGDGFATYDAGGRPVFVDRTVEKSGVKFTIESVTETSGTPPVTVYTAKAALPVDADCRALLTKDAIEHDGKVYELAGDARVKRTLIDGIEHHVRVRCTREEQARSVLERITVTPRGGQDDDGARLPDGPAFSVVALAVDAGNTAERYGAEGTTLEADFTVVVALGSGIGDGDLVTVRGRDGVARVQREFSQHADRNQDVILVRSRAGGD